MTNPRFRFYAATPTGAEPLETPGGAAAVNDVYDQLPLGVYSRLRTFHQVRFLGLEEHLDRTDRSLDLLGLQQRLDRAALRRSIHDALDHFDAPDAFVRFDVLREPASQLGTASSTLISLVPFEAVPAEYLRDGVGLGFTKLVRRHPRAKEASWVQERGGEESSRPEEYDRLLCSPEGRILEGTSSNFYAVRDGVLRTAGHDVLEGVTKRFCLRLARQMGLPVEERALELSEIPLLTEAFLTSSSRGVVPVVRIGAEQLGAGRPGPWSARLLLAYDELAEREAVPAWPQPS